MTNGKNGNGSGNGVHKDASIIGDHDLLWDGLSPAVTQKLSEPLDPSLVSRRKGRGNRSFAYVEGRTAIDQANRIFGFGGWGHEVVGEVALREIDNVDPKTGEVTRIRAYSATVQGHRGGSALPHRRRLPHGGRGERRGPRNGLQGRGH